MADFLTAYKATAIVEGGYTTDPHETWRGIDRVECPGWHGWALVDQIKASSDRLNPESGSFSISSLNQALAVNTELQQMVLDFFQANYWNAVKGDEINDQAFANKVYDAGVNMGTGEAIRLMQVALGDTPDGDIGPDTIASVNNTPESVELAKFKNVRVEHYEAIVGKNPADQKYLASWLSRC